MFMQAKQLLLKLTTSHFNSLNEEFANENVMKRILVAVCNENKANAMRTSGPIPRNPYAACTSSRQE